MVALCRRMTSANASGRVVLDPCGWYIFASLCNLAFRMGETRRPSGAWSSTESKEVGWDVFSNAPVSKASRMGVNRVGGIGCVAGEPSALTMWGD